jgi:hypothetical protein
MKTALNVLLLTGAVGLGFAAGPADAALETIYSLSVAPSHCQAFTPGVTNTIRNRVSGAENIGEPLALACSFENIGSIQGTFNTVVAAGFYNNSGAANMTINCTNLNGYFGAVGSTINKTVTIAAVNGSNGVTFSAADTPSTSDTNLGSFYSGINCTMPTGSIMTWTEARWQEDFA